MLELGVLVVGLLVVVAVVIAVVVLIVKSRTRRPTYPMPSKSPGWYPDPANPSIVRWFDGHQWTPQTQPRLS